MQRICSIGNHHCMISNRILFLIILFLSFAVAGLLLIGNIDPDFFSYYYVGRGIIDGKDMFRDFANNKGPVLYLFFALLYFLFGNNYNLALVVGNGLLDAISIYYLFRLLVYSYGLQIKGLTISNAILILFSVLLYKSFSISSFMGGVYSEQLGMMFLILSLWKYEQKNYVISGLFFALSILTRSSFLFFIIIFPIISLIRKHKSTSLIFFGRGVAICIVPIVLLFILNGSMRDFIYNNTIFNVQYSHATSDIRLFSLINVSLVETRIILIFLYVTFFVFTSIFFSKDKKKSLLIATIYISSLVATNPGGIFYPHHFVQFMIITFIALFQKRVRSTIPILVIVMLFVVLSYVIYAVMPRHSFTPSIPEVSQAEYLMVISYYPKFYFIFNKEAPDRYYQSFFLLDFFNKSPAEDVKRHKALNNDKLKKTLFMMVEFRESDKLANVNYLKKFSRDFHLTKKKVYQYENGKIELYMSKL